MVVAKHLLSLFFDVMVVTGLGSSVEFKPSNYRIPVSRKTSFHNWAGCQDIH